MKRNTQQGFTLVELMIVVAIIGILAAVALPQYQNYTIRAKVSQAVASLSAVQTCVSEVYQSNGSLADSLVSTLCSVASNSYFLSMGPGATGVVASGNSTALGAAVSATLSNNYNTSNPAGTNLTWTCTGSTLNYFPASCRG